MRLSLLSLSLCAFACASPSINENITSSEPGPTLSDIQALEGTWVAVGPDGMATDTVMSVIKPTAGGSAMVETLFPGEPQEMVSVYHMDGTQLVMTHYCAMGNQPHMVGSYSPEGDLTFVCTGASNVESEDDPHMHAGTFKMLGEDRVEARWDQYTAGEMTMSAPFDMMRVER